MESRVNNAFRNRNWLSERPFFHSVIACSLCRSFPWCRASILSDKRIGLLGLSYSFGISSSLCFFHLFGNVRSSRQVCISSSGPHSIFSPILLYMLRISSVVTAGISTLSCGVSVGLNLDLWDGESIETIFDNIFEHNSGVDLRP